MIRTRCWKSWGVSSPVASRLTAKIFNDTLEQMEADSQAVLPQAVWKRLKQLCLVLEGKKGPEICALYRRLAGLTQRQLDRQVEGENGKPVRLRFACFDREHQGSFRLLAALALCRTIRTDGDEELCRLAVELQGQVEDDFLAPAVAARLMTQPPAESYAWAEKQLLRSGLLGTKVRQKAVCPIQYALEAAADPALDIRWFTLLIRVGSGMDEVLLNLLSRGKVPDLPEAVGNYLYHMGLKSPITSRRSALLRCWQSRDGQSGITLWFGGPRKTVRVHLFTGCSTYWTRYLFRLRRRRLNSGNWIDWCKGKHLPSSGAAGLLRRSRST